VTRLAWTPELEAANEWLAGRMTDAGLAVDRDAAGNVFGRWDGGEGKAVLLGSHLDTVPRGGRYDGALGVVGALHAIRALRERGVRPKRPVWLVSFTDEEGARFRTALFGSRAFVGADAAAARGRRGGDGVALEDAMVSAGFDFARLGDAARVNEVAAYLELHIEQGPVLERAGVDVGIVSSIVGLIGYAVSLSGEANHAGTTPMAARRDALAGAARVVLALRDEARSRPDMTANVGTIEVEPGGTNVVPGICRFSIDVRSSARDGIERVERFTRDCLERVAAEEGLELTVRETYRLPFTDLDEALRGTLRRAAELEGATYAELPSGAGHDGMVLARHVPAAMLFVPSRGGISHSPAEYTSPEQCELSVRVLARAVELLVT
jgi:hydantoinase/carbamoylase family amidase